jgi:hypothetical protein
MINTAIKEDLENPQPYNPGKGKEDLENPQPYNPGNGKEEAKFYTLTLKS